MNKKLKAVFYTLLFLLGFVLYIIMFVNYPTGTKFFMLSLLSCFLIFIIYCVIYNLLD